MSTVKEIVNTVESLWDQADITPEDIVGIILAERWNGNRYNHEVMDLSDDELLSLEYWITTNRNSYRRILDMSNDMDEIFPGMAPNARLQLLAPRF